MPSINFTGLASGLDTRAIIDAILEAERAPIERLQARRDVFSQQRAALDDLGKKIGALEGALRDLRSDTVFRGRTATVSDESVLRASAGANAETGVFSIEVLQLAAADKVKSDPFAATDQGLVSDGTITIQSGSNDPITIDVRAADFNNSLDSVRDAINDADAGVEASIIFDGANYLLTVRAEETGLENALTITDSTNLDLDAGGNQVTVAADASVRLDGVNGITVTSSSNQVRDVIPGVTLDLLSTNEDSPISVEIETDTEGVADAIQTVVDSYNELIDFFNAQSDTANPGPLSGDATLRGVQLRVQSLFTTGIEGIPLGQIRSLSSLGVGFDGRSGRATLDTSELNDLLETSFDEIGDVFLSSGSTTNPRIRFVSATGETVPGTYAVQIDSVSERATLTGQGVITQLNKNEALTITVDDSSGSNTIVSNLLKNMDLTEIIDQLNADFAANGIAATADSDSGKLRISTDEFGSDVSLTVESSRNPGVGGRTGFTKAPQTDLGADLAGQIDGVDGTVNGQFLIGAAGTDVEGLVVQVKASAADVAATGGEFGTVSYSRGLLDKILDEVDAVTQFDSGTLDIARESLDRNLERLADDIVRVEDRLVVREARLLKVFTAAEQAISLLQAQQSSLNG